MRWRWTRALGVATAWGSAWAAGCAATSPDDTARIAVWHDAPVPGGVRIYADGLYAGTLRHYVARGTPRCASRGTVTFSIPAATWIVVVAESSDRRRWTRVVRADAGSCRTLPLLAREAREWE